MNIAPLAVDQNAACEALKIYRQHRGSYDKLDWEIERVYRAIAKGKTVINAYEAIVRAGLDTKGRPKLAICEAHAVACKFSGEGDVAIFGIIDPAAQRWTKAVGWMRIPWPGVGYVDAIARLPRIPPNLRPQHDLSGYHMLWEADWTDIPKDHYLLRRIGKAAWVVVAAWDLTEVEVSVVRAWQPRMRS